MYSQVGDVIESLSYCFVPLLEIEHDRPDGVHQQDYLGNGKGSHVGIFKIKVNKKVSPTRIIS